MKVGDIFQNPDDGLLWMTCSHDDGVWNCAVINRLPHGELFGFTINRRMRTDWFYHLKYVGTIEDVLNKMAPPSEG